jgi:hypothetical protein
LTYVLFYLPFTLVHLLSAVCTLIYAIYPRRLLFAVSLLISAYSLLQY